jgi:protein-disulfide isomerase
MKSEMNVAIPRSKLTLPLVGRDHIQGTVDAPVTLLEYGDYECPYCGEAYAIVKAIQERLDGRLCFTFRNFPLTNSHPHAERAAEAAEAAGAQGRFWEMHDLLFENQDSLEIQNLTEYASALDLDAQQLVGEVLSRVHLARVREDFQSGARSGVNGTPTFFINGVRYDGPVTADELLGTLTENLA